MTSQQDVGSSLLLSENKLTTKAVVLMKWKNESVFSGKFEFAIIQLSLEENTFAIKPQFPGSQK